MNLLPLYKKTQATYPNLYLPLEDKVISTGQLGLLGYKNQK